MASDRAGSVRPHAWAASRRGRRPVRYAMDTLTELQTIVIG
jgi:hypothetical protein